MNQDRYKLMNAANELYKIRVYEDSFQGLLNPPFDHSIESYNMPALEYKGQISHYKEEDVYLFTASIFSIDDSGLTFHYQKTTKEKAKKQFDNFVKWIEDMTYTCPNKKQVEEYCKMNNTYHEYW